MFRSVAWGLVFLAGAATVGCGGASNSSSQIAIVDLDKVLQMTGLDLEMDNEVKEREALLRIRLSSLQQKLEEQWMQKKNEFGDNPNDEQKLEIQQVLNQISAQSQQARAQANQDISSFQQQLFSRFQQEIGSISQEVAKDQGYSVVLGKNPSILAYDTTTDITDSVIERLKQLKQPRTGGAGQAAPETGAAQPGTSLTPPLTPSLTPPLVPEMPAQGKPAESTPAPAKVEEKKPEVSAEPAAKQEKTQEKPEPAPTEAKPVAEKPAGEAKPAEAAKPAAEPAEKAPAEKAEEAKSESTETSNAPAEPAAN